MHYNPIKHIFFFLVILLVVVFSSSMYAQTWVQRGFDIDGEASDDLSGTSVSLSSNGSILAIGAEGNGTFTGHVRVYQWNGGAWVQRGSDIDGEEVGDLSGKSVSLSSDGTILAIGATLNDGNGTSSGHVRVYHWNGLAWVQRGSDIDGEAALDRSGASISLSSDGTILAIGARQNDGNGSKAGHVRVYHWNGGAWVQRGFDIDAEASDDRSGTSVSLSSDGSILAIGAPLNDGNGTSSGHVRVYHWNGLAWVQRGFDIDGEAFDDFSGESVSLSSDGTILAIGAHENDGNGNKRGHVRIYHWNGSAWVQRGVDIDGEADGDRSGESISLSSDGTILAIGAQFNNGNGISSGHVRVYHWNGSAWVQRGFDVDGEAAQDNSHLVSLSSDGTILAIGAQFNDKNGNNAGHVRVFNHVTTSQQVTVTLTATGTATGGGTDYTLASSTITINAGVTTGTTTVTAVQDVLDEADETVILDITGVTNATENGTQQETITITDDGGDNDQDGLLDDVDLDDDNDGIYDSLETSDDLDSDGIPNWFDLDSDGDGCADVIEAGFSDPDNDGILCNSPVSVDSLGRVLCSESSTCYPFKKEDFKLLSDAVYAKTKDPIHQSYSSIVLTPKKKNKKGMVWFKKKVNLTADFSVSAQLNFGDLNASGADGIAFVMQPLSTDQGAAGGGLGYKGISPSVAVEFDTWYNGNFEIGNDHAAITYNGNTSTHHHLVDLKNIEDGKWHPVKIEWNVDLKTIKVTFDGKVIITSTKDIIADIFSSNPYVYFGFTAATGNSMNKQSVKILESCNVLEGASISDGYTEPLDNDNSGVYDYKEIGSSVTIINQPESIIMVESTDSIVYIDITAEGTVDYQWQASNNNGQSWENIASNYPYYEVINAPLDYNDKVFRVVISTPAYMCDQDVISQPFTINILPDNSNPPTVTLSVSPATIAEAAGVSTVTATLSAAFSQNVTVTLTADGTAIGGGTDYTLASNTITINAGSTTGATTVTSVQDLLNEVNETVILDIAGVTNGTENGIQQETVTIIDDDGPPTVTLSVSPATIAEAAGVSTVTATLSAAFSQNVTVTLTATGTATGSGTDYTLASNTITINAGSTTGATTITAVQDVLDEVNETVILDIAGVTNGTENGTQQETVTIIDDDGDDNDQDGVFDNVDLDDDNDGIYDSLETSDDLDSDGIPNWFDLDSDGDGCDDVIEAGYTDGDNDGILGSSPVTVDGLGRVTSGVDGYSEPLDGDNSGVFDFLEELFFQISIINHPSSIDNITVNERISFSVEVTSNNSLFYQWQMSRNYGTTWENLQEGNIYLGVNTNELTIIDANVETHNNAIFRVHISSPGVLCYNFISNEAFLIVYEDINIPNGFSPDGDGVNDTWKIKGLNKYPNHKVEVYNRWKDKVYEKSNYENQWDGTSNINHILRNDKKLPEATYYYLVYLGNGLEPFKGYVYLKRRK